MPMTPTATGYDLIDKRLFRPAHRAVTTAETAAANLLAKAGLPPGRYVLAKHVNLVQSSTSLAAEEAAQRRNIILDVTR